MSEQSLEGRVALVTGASSGIGRACAITLAAEGAQVLVNHYRDAEAAQEIVDGIESRGGRAFAHEADVGDESQVHSMFDRLLERYGTLHVLVNNAGIQRDAAFLDMSLADWQAVIETNLRGQFLCGREAAREFCARARRDGDEQPSRSIGQMIFMSSVHDEIPWAGHANYAVAKAGVEMLMRSLAQELGPSRIRINAVSPGAIKTDINREAWTSPDGRRDLLTKIPYGRIGEPEDVAKAVLWLASEDSDYVHGHTLYIDGGMTLYPGFRAGGS